MVLCTAVYLAENKSFAFLDSSFLGTDGWSDAVLKQLELGRVCKYTRMGMGRQWERQRLRNQTFCPPQTQTAHQSSHWLVELLEIPKTSTPLDGVERNELGFLHLGTTLIFCCSFAKSCPILCNPKNCSTPGFSVLHYLPEFAQTHVH